MELEPSRKILVVDDNPASRYATSRVLKSHGFEVVEAQTGQEGVDLAYKGVDLVVLDVNLPDIDGFEVCRRIRSNPATTRTPVIHLSATFVKDADKVHGLEAGADGYLTHPVEPPVLTATINAFLRARAAEEQMRRSETKFRAIFDGALTGIALISKELIYLEVNPAMCELMGRPRQEIVGKRVDIFIPDGKKEEGSQIAAQLERALVWRGVLPFVRPDNRTVQLDWNVSTHSMPGVSVAIVSDITERLAAEEQRRHLLTSERAARADAEKANRLKDEFLATLSHELRTPLNAIVGWSQILRRGHPSAEEVADGLDAIERNAKVQTQLISDLLDVSRITSGKLRLDIQPVDPARTVSMALDSVAHAAQIKGIKIARQLDPAAGLVMADANRLQQVIWNLVTNAIKFTPREGHIAVGVRRIDAHVEISVTDNGQGMKPELIPHIFNRFQQGDATTTRNHGGLGLGLAIVKHLVGQHGGTVCASSPGEGQGATFVVCFPAAPVAGAPQFIGSPSDSPAFRKRCDLSGVKILAVDDDLDGRTLLRRILLDCGAEVADARTVAEAIIKLHQFMPHVVISDIGMPDEDGYDLIRQIREGTGDIRSVPAIALTAFARTEDRRRAMLAGYQVHLSKPVDPGELATVVASLAGRV